MIRRIFRIVAVTAALGALAVAGAYVGRISLLRWRLELPSFTHAPGEEREVVVRARDGIELATQIHLPRDARGTASWPTVLIRNPYDAGVMISGWCELFVRYGYACVYQEARGQMGSGGEWDPIVHEPGDGEDTLRWLVEQPFQDGNIAFYGPSYLGAVQWAMAARGLPPEVKTMVPIMTGTDFREVAYQRGMFRHEILTAWSALMPGRGFKTENAEGYREALRHRPHLEVDERYFGKRLPWYRDWISSPSPRADFWQREDLALLMAAPSKLEIPILAIAGWYDLFFGAQLRDWQSLATRDRSKLVIGPWTHIMEPGGDLDLPDARGNGFQWRLVLDWLGHHLRGAPLAQSASGVERYVIGWGRRGVPAPSSESVDGVDRAGEAGPWQHAASWPPPTRARRLYLGAFEAAHGCDGGRLSPVPPQPARRVAWIYDPDDPVPMRGGAGSLAFILPGFGGGPVASVEQGGLCERADVLSFASAAFDAPLHVAGAPRVTLTVSSDAPDTAFTAKLVEVRADGSAYNVRDGIATLEFRRRDGGAEGYEPGSAVDVEIETWPIEWVFEAGSRLRLDVSSSNFPAYHAHPNRAGVWAAQTDAAPARQTLYAGEIELPVVVAP